jgi:Glyoxalase/Bleomycin resistance protein/Dioxygenase superfamily
MRERSAAFPGAGPVQLAYHVSDPARAAVDAAARFGWGPFFLMEHIALEWSRHRGRDVPFDHTSAYGQAGEIMIEFITQHDDAPSALRDLYRADQQGLHHVAYFVPELEAAIAAGRAMGYAAALEARTRTGVEFAMLDATATLGHMIELYEPGADLRRFYAYVKHKSRDWDGHDPVRSLR